MRIFRYGSWTRYCLIRGRRYRWSLSRTTGCSWCLWSGCWRSFGGRGAGGRNTKARSHEETRRRGGGGEGGVGSGEEGLKFLEEWALGGDYFLLGLFEGEPLGAVDFGEGGLFSGAWGPFEGEGVGLDLGGVEVAGGGEGVDGF